MEKRVIIRFHRLLQDLTYGEYKVTVMVTTAAEGRSTYYLDGVRVYNPIQGLEEDQLVQDAYGADHELNAVFQEVRDILVTQANLPEEISSPITRLFSSTR